MFVVLPNSEKKTGAYVNALTSRIMQERKWNGYRILDGKLRTPFADHMPGIVPPVIEDAHFQMILPCDWQHSTHRPMCIHLAATGDHVSRTHGQGQALSFVVSVLLATQTPHGAAAAQARNCGHHHREPLLRTAQAKGPGEVESAPRLGHLCHGRLLDTRVHRAVAVVREDGNGPAGCHWNIYGRTRELQLVKNDLMLIR